MLATFGWLHFALFGCVILLASGQVLMKKAALAYAGAGSALSFAVLWPLGVGFVLYAASSLIWVWLLQYVPLSRAYSYVAVAFVLVPIAGWWVFDEPLGIRYCIGVLLIIGGILLTLEQK